MTCYQIWYNAADGEKKNDFTMISGACEQWMTLLVQITVIFGAVWTVLLLVLKRDPQSYSSTRTPGTESNPPQMEFIVRGFHRTCILLIQKEFDIWFMIAECKLASLRWNTTVTAHCAYVKYPLNKFNIFSFEVQIF